MIDAHSLPAGEQTVAVYALPTGHLQLPDRWLFEDASEDLLHDRQYSPDFSFLIKHPRGKVVFDLGLRKDLENNPQAIKDEYALISIEIPRDAKEILDSGPEHSSSVTAVVLSHLHFDHTGDCMKFPDAELIVGPGSSAATAPGWPEAKGSPFDGAVLKHPHFRELSFEKDDWQRVGPFSRCIDYFGDQSFYIIDAPGHMDGHLGGLARTGVDEWVFIGGDCCHHRSLLTGARPMSITVGPSKTPSFHRYPDVAKSTIEKVRALERQGRVLIALAHDARLDGVMPEYPEAINGWKSSSWKKALDQELARDYPKYYLTNRGTTECAMNVDGKFLAR